MALQRAPSRLSLLPRKPRQRRDAALARLADEDADDADNEYYSRKTRGQRLYSLRASLATFAAKPGVCETIAEIDQDTPDESDDL